MNNTENIPNDKEVYQLYSSLTNQAMPYNCIKEIVYRPASEFDEHNYVDGEHELGEGKWINNNEHININERCDCHLWLVEHPVIKAISLSHFHRQGLVGKLTVFIK